MSERLPERVKMTRFEMFSVSILSLCLGIQISFVSANMNGSFHHRQDSVKQQLALFTGDPMPYDGELADYPQARNRILFPAFLWALSTFAPFFQPSEWYLILRVVSGVMLFGVAFSCFWARSGNLYISIAGQLLLAYSFLPTFSHPWEHPWDYGDSIFTLLIVAMAINVANQNFSHKLLFFGLCLLAATNRESAAFGGIIWFFVRSRKMSNIGFSVFVSTIVYAFAVLLRHWFGSEFMTQTQVTGTTIQGEYEDIMGFLSVRNPFSPLVMFSVIFTPLLLVALKDFKYFDDIARGLFASAITIGAISAVYGNMNELRVFIPTFTLLVFLAVHLETRRMSPKPGARPAR